MDASDVEWVHNKLVEIMQQDNDTLKGIMFNYNRIYPIARIVKTMKFKESITKYVNKQKIKTIPTQYIYSYVDDVMISDNINYQITDQVLEAIRNLKTLEKRQMLAEDSLNSVSWKDIKFQEDFCERLKKEFPEIKCEKIINRVEERLKEGTYGIEIISTGIFSKIYYKINEKKYTIKKLSEIRVAEYPLKECDFDSELKNMKLKDMVDLLNCIGKHLEEGKKKWRFTTIEEVELIWKYRQMLCWKCMPYNFDFLIVKYILENSQISEDIVICYFNAFFNIFKRVFPQKIKINIDYDKLMNFIKNSSIATYQKVVVLSLLGKRENYEEYIQTLLEQYNNKGLDNINDIKEILYHVV